MNGSEYISFWLTLWIEKDNGTLGMETLPGWRQRVERVTIPTPLNQDEN